MFKIVSFVNLTVFKKKKRKVLFAKLEQSYRSTFELSNY